MRPVSRKRRALLIVLAFAMGPLSRAVHADPLYQVTDLGAIQVFGLNNSGQVLGQAAAGTSPWFDSGGPMTSFVYNSYGSNAGQQVSIPLGSVSAINNNGIVAGFTASPTMPTAVLYDTNSPTGNETAVPTNLPGTLGNGVGNGTITGLNDSNQVVGTAYTAAPPGTPISSANDHLGPQHAYLSNGGTVTDLGLLGGSSPAATVIPGAWANETWVNPTLQGPQSAATAINDAGQIVGTSSLPNGISHAFLYSAGKMTDLGGLPGYNFTTATAINASGAVVGYSTNSAVAPGVPTSAFLYSDGKMTNLGDLPGGGNYSVALGINSQGTIIGDSNGHAFVYQNGVMTDLNNLVPTSSGFRLSMAQYINDAGQIVVQGIDSRGVLNEYLLTPTGMPAPVAPELTGSEIPEPSTLAFAALLGGLACARWGCRQLGRLRSRRAA
ncbi:MAG TPA: DUF3466 family protein [Isosphaeraceae bacterium]|nr:DUF3466 family protein [Isosphaeraceae bacterium]